MRRLVAVIACCLLTGVSFGGAPLGKLDDLLGNRVTLTAKAAKGVYEPGEAVPLGFAIANSGAQSIYIAKTEPYIEFKDACGIVMGGDPIDTPPSAPAHYYVARAGKKILTVPVFKIDGPGMLLEMIPDGLQRYHKHLSEGNYYLRAIVNAGFYNEADLIFRKDFPDQLWVEAKGGLFELDLESNSVHIEIRKVAGFKELLLRSGFFAWPSFWVGLVCGITLLLPLWLLKKKRAGIRQ